MSDHNVVQLIQPGLSNDPLTEVLRNGARSLLAKAVEAEVAAFLAKHADLRTEDGRSRIVRRLAPSPQIFFRAAGLPFPPSSR